MIMPADRPRIAYLSKNAERIKLTEDPDPKSEIRNPESQTGRAEMEYRDLIPDRLGGFLVASHIRILNGGEVPDYVHYHKLLFQTIYCRSGWVRVVYEGQGESFVMNEGDCILQPPEIRHRVLESSAGAEVIEVSSPAVHETWVEHEMSLPTAATYREKSYHDQRFVRHIADQATWKAAEGYRYRDTGIAAATGNKADVRVVRVPKAGRLSLPSTWTSFVFILDGEMTDELGSTLRRDGSFATEPDRISELELSADRATELLQVTISPDLAHFFFATSVPTNFDP